MIKCKKKIGIIVGIVIIALLMFIFIHPLLFKKNHIEKIALIHRLDIGAVTLEQKN